MEKRCEGYFHKRCSNADAYDNIFTGSQYATLQCLSSALCPLTQQLQAFDLATVQCPVRQDREPVLGSLIDCPVRLRSLCEDLGLHF